MNFCPTNKESCMSVKNLSRTRRLLLACAVAGVALGAAAASVVYVNAERLDIMDKKRAVAKIVTTVDRNAALNVIAQEGKWYKVEVGGKQGYVFAEAVSDKPGGAKGKGVSLAAVKGGSIPQLETAAAVKGVRPGAQQYASSSRLSTTGLQEVIRRRDAITSAKFDQFLAKGGLSGTARGAASLDDSAVAVSEVKP
jgi:uncharacterized protein YgiM (DUF1202 family)